MSGELLGPNSARTRIVTRTKAVVGAAVVRAAVVRAGVLRAGVLSAAVVGTVALAGCSSISIPTPPTPTTTGTSTATSAQPTTTVSEPSVRTSTVPRYNVTRLLDPDIDNFPTGSPGPHGGVLQQQMVGTTTISVAGATGPVAMYLPCCRDYAHQALDYQVGSTRVDRPTEIPIADDQGFVLDGRLIAIDAIEQVGTQPRVQARVIVFPASAARGLPIVK